MVRAELPLPFSPKSSSSSFWPFPRCSELPALASSFYPCNWSPNRGRGRLKTRPNIRPVPYSCLRHPLFMPPTATADLAPLQDDGYLTCPCSPLRRGYLTCPPFSVPRRTQRIDHTMFDPNSDRRSHAPCRMMSRHPTRPLFPWTFDLSPVFPSVPYFPFLFHPAPQTSDLSLLPCLVPLFSLPFMSISGKDWRSHGAQLQDDPNIRPVPYSCPPIHVRTSDPSPIPVDI